MILMINFGSLPVHRASEAIHPSRQRALETFK
jgi:hypothetical protein